MPTSFDNSPQRADSTARRWVLCKANLSQTPFVTCEQYKADVKSVAPASPAVLEPKALPHSALDWLLDPRKTQALTDRVLARLVQLEAHEVNAHFKDDYRQAWITLSFANNNIADPFVAASYQMFGVHPDKESDMNHEEWNLEHEKLADERRHVAFEMAGLVTALVRFHDITEKPLTSNDWDTMRQLVLKYAAADKALDAFWEAHPHCDLLPSVEEDECTTQK